MSWYSWKNGMVHSFVLFALAPIEFLGKTSLIIVNAIRWVSSFVTSDLSPFENLYDYISDSSSLKVFGFTCLNLHPLVEHSKLSSHSSICVLLSYGQKGCQPANAPYKFRAEAFMLIPIISLPHRISDRLMAGQTKTRHIFLFFHRSKFRQLFDFSDFLYFDFFVSFLTYIHAFLRYHPINVLYLILFGSRIW